MVTKKKFLLEIVENEKLTDFLTTKDTACM